MTMIWLALVALFVAFIAGVFLAYVYIGQEEYVKRLQLQATINALEARALPPRILEVWFNHEEGARLGVYLGSIDADKTIEALSLVASGVRTFSEEGLSGVLTRREVSRLRRELLSRNLAAWNPSGKNMGIVWTDDGKALLEQCKNEGMRTHAHAHPTAKRRPPTGVGEGIAYV